MMIQSHVSHSRSWRMGLILCGALTEQDCKKAEVRKHHEALLKIKRLLGAQQRAMAQVHEKRGSSTFITVPIAEQFFL